MNTRLQHVRDHWGTQADISSEHYEFLITAADAPNIKQISVGKNSTCFVLEDGSEVSNKGGQPEWLLAWGETEQDAMESFWDEYPEEAPESYRVAKRARALAGRIERIANPSVLDAVEKVLAQ